MKKIIIICSLLSMAFSMNAQLRVESNGQVCIGTSTNAVIGDSTAALKVRGDIGTTKSNTIAFGNSRDVYIREIINSFPSYNHYNSLSLGGKGGLRYECGTSTIFTYDPTLKSAGTGVTFNFNVPLSTPQILTQSDANLKSNIKSLENICKSIEELSPVSYTLKTYIDDNAKNSEAERAACHKNLQYGFIAQEVKEVYPDLVFENAEGILSIDYMGFIPILVDAIKDLKVQVREQQAAIDVLMMYQRKGNFPNTNAVTASLSQNRPNPFRVSTSIECIIPESVASSFICIYDLNGNQKLRRDISQHGKVEVFIEANTLSAGMYIYTLVCDGQEIDSKRMIITD